MKLDKNTLVLYAVTDRMWTGKKTLYEQIEESLKGGVTCVQLREKDMSYEEFLDEAIKIKGLCNRYNVPLIINDNFNIALECGADGIHVGQDDISIKEIRSIVGDNMIIGVSVHDLNEAIYAVENGADYLGVGAMFTTSTKKDAQIVSIDTLHEICMNIDIPVVAIGGINKNNISLLSKNGLSGFALVSAIFSVDNIKNECKELYKLCSNNIGF